jgi:hypothetical protein
MNEVTRSKKHHYYPEFNLKYFADTDGLVNVYSIEKKGFQRIPPKNLAYINDFYTFTDSTGEKTSLIEDVLANIDGNSSIVIRKLEKGDFTITDEERVYMSYYIAFQQSRTPYEREKINRMSEQADKFFLRVATSYKDLVKNTADKVIARYPELDKYSVEDVKKFFQSDEYKIVYPQEHALKIMMGNIETFASIIYKMKWKFLIAPSDSLYLTSDVPFTMLQTDQSNTYLGKPLVGYFVSGTEISMPITSKISFLAAPDNDTEGIFYVSQSVVRTINWRTARNAYRYLFSSNERLLKRMVRRVKII